MSTISEISAKISPTTSSTKSSSDSSTSVSQEEFLNLLVTQMQHQDPLNPQDPSEYMSQLAQFSNLEQLVNANDSLSTVIDQQAYSTQLQAASYVGKQVEVSGNVITMSGGTSSTAHYYLPRDSTSTTLNVYNEAGKLVDTVDLGDVTAGTKDITWDGQLSNGTTASDGKYTFEVAATDSDDQSITVDPSFDGTVTSVMYDSSGVYLQLDGETLVPLSSLYSVSG